MRRPRPQPHASSAKAAAKRPHIPQAVRDEVWKRCMGNVFEAKCPISWCTERVSVRNHVLAHNVPFSKGGATTIANLRVTCQACNLGMSDTFTVDQWDALDGAARGAGTGGTARTAAPTTCGCWPW